MCIYTHKIRIHIYICLTGFEVLGLVLSGSQGAGVGCSTRSTLTRTDCNSTAPYYRGLNSYQYYYEVPDYNYSIMGPKTLF